MTFNSLQFFAFFAVVLVLYYRLPRRGQNGLMFVAGSIFYGAFDWRFLGLLYFSIAVDYLVGRALGVTEAERRRKQLLAVSICSQIGILLFFKYFDFFSKSASDLLERFGVNSDPVLLKVALPVGISFYTFQSLAYVFAVYRRQLDAERDLVNFAAFVAWFPQLVAGPIERATSLLPQIRRRRNAPDWALAESGVVLIVRGLFKKVVIADSVASYVNTVFAKPGSFRWSVLLVAAIGFAIQVYGDFSGYSDIARGSSRLLGVELRRNFEQPLLSRDMREFWTRWHTSLSWWFVEHVGQPLGGASGGRVKAALNVLVIFTLIGLWHGAAWTFVLWGVYNGVLVVIWRQFRPPRGRHPMRVRAREIPGIAFTFGLFAAGGVVFRAASFQDARVFFRHLLTFSGGKVGPSGALLVLVMLAATFWLEWNERRQRIAAIELTRTRASLGSVGGREEGIIESMVWSSGSINAGVVLGVMAVAIIVFSGGAPTPFIYFQF